MIGDAEAFLAAARSRGVVVNEDDVRDAAHEVCHALRWKVRRRWTRANIDAASPVCNGDRLREEVLARAVEQLVCMRFGVRCESVEIYGLTACLESLDLDNAVWPIDKFIECVHAMMRNPIADAMVKRVMGLAREVERRCG